MGLVGRHIQEGNTALGKHIGQRAHHGFAELAFQVGHHVLLARAADLLIKGLGVGQIVGVNAKGANPHRAKFLIANGYWLGRAPVLVDLLPGREEIDV